MVAKLGVWVKVKIADIKPAPYNPRKMSDRQLQMLAKAMSEFGDLSGFIVNITTGNLVGGHQRLKNIPKDAIIEKQKLEKISKTGTIADGYIVADGERWNYREVEWDLYKEKMANIAANKHSGEFDMDKLSEILCDLQDQDMSIDLELLGFDIGIEDLSPDNAIMEYQKAFDMPEFKYEPRGYRTIHVHFKTEDALKCFTKELNVKITDKTKYIWYPINVP